ncbi:MAG: cysteine desulfurase-like protein [Gemmatimonadales bacterium]
MSAAALKVLSVEEIRAQFPALARVYNGFPVAYFDGPGGTQVPRRVAEAMVDYLYHHNANTHWAYPTSAETDAALTAARQAFADFLNASPAEIAFGANMTTLTYHLSRALGRGWNEGDEIVVTELDHHANIDPWRALAVECGVTIRSVPVDVATGTTPLEAIRAAIGPRTRLVAIGMASNALGTVTDVAAVCRMARDGGALSFVDAVHAAAHLPLDVQAIGCDFLACSPYKFYGPHLGVLYGREALIAGLDVPKLVPSPDYAPERLETGTQNHEGIVGAAAAVEFLASLAPGAPDRRSALVAALTALHHRGEVLFRQLWDGLGAVPGVRCYGPPPGATRTPTLGLTVPGKSSEQVAIALAESGVFVSHGDFYATTVVERLGLAEEGLVRVGCACYTTAEEVARVVEGVKALR